MIQSTAGLAGDGVFGGNILGPLDTLRGQLKGPGKEKSEGETDHPQPRHQGQGPVGKAQGRRYRIRDLDDQPAEDDVGDTDPEYIAAPELRK